MSHNAIIAEIQKLETIQGADNIQIAYVLGERVIVSKQANVGDKGVFFQADLQLSHEYCFENNLYRHSDLNKDNTKKGFFDDNRRVRTQTFMKVKSEAYFATLDSLEYTKADISELKIMDNFSELNKHLLCEKYVSEQSRKTMDRLSNQKNKPKKYSSVPDFVKHVDTDQFKHYVGFIPEGAILSFHAKKHGTSMRVGCLKEYHHLSNWKKRINQYIPLFPEYVWKHEVGTRNVILSSPDKEGFHGSEQYRYDILEQLKPHIEKGMILFGEVVGYVNGKSIMPSHSIESLKHKEYTKKYGKTVNYAYGCNEGEYKFHIYRITYVNEDGKLLDFSNEQVIEWCSNHGVNGPLTIHPTIIYDGNQDALVNLVEQLTERPECLTEDYEDSRHISEGVIVRWDRGQQIPKFYKSKSYAFRVMEGLCEAEDQEAIS